ncbi:MAG TPA: HAD-IB family phosphatase [Thermoplasmata archaeon]|nr:HAD-IB family phosphatase [Thermoplasmata archaeon]
MQPPTDRAHPGLEVFLDFDGTLVDPNVAIVLIAEFVPDGKRIANEVDLELHAGKITLRQAWEREAALLSASRVPEMADWVRREVPLRSGARELLALLKTHHVPTTIISGGLDFYIGPVLEREGIDVPFLSDTSVPDPAGHLRVEHPYGHPTCRLCGICKAQAVAGASRAPNGTRKVFVGDGSTDRYAAEVADLVFARRRLMEICTQRGIPFYPFETFHPVTEQLGRWLDGTEPFPARRRPGLASSPCPISQELAAGAA